MSARRLVIECGAAETRATLLMGDAPLGFWFGPARGDELLPRPPEHGDIFLGRSRRGVPAMRAAFVDIGASAEGFLVLGKDEKAPNEGAAAIFKVRRPPIAAKGAVLALNWRAGLGAAEISAVEGAAKHEDVGLLNNADATALALRAFAGPAIDAIEVNSPEAAAALRPLQAIVCEDPDVSDDLDAAVDCALERIAPLPGGGRLVIDETEGGAVVDVDTGADDLSAANANDRVNAAAAAALFRELSRRAIGGRVIVDFLPIGNRDARKVFLKALTNGSKNGYECRFGELSADGLLDLRAPRRRLSLLERATEPDASFPRPGRRFTLDWSAKAAIRKLESFLKRRTNARPKLLVGREIGDYLAKGRPQWSERLAARFGARFAIAPDDRLEPRGFDISE